jgi:hypothetical protein
MSAPRNVFPIKLIKNWASSINSINIVTPGEAPKFPSSIGYVLSDVESSLKRLGPSIGPLDILGYAMESHAVHEALWHAYHSQSLITEENLRDQFVKSFIQNGYTFHQAAESSDSITSFVLSNRKYKPVGMKIHPVVSYNPDSCPLVFKPLNIGELPPLLTKPMKLEDLIYTDRIMHERMALILGKIPSGFLSKVEVELLTHLILKYQDAFAFEEHERGTFNTKYFPPYEMPTIPHEPWMKKNIWIPLGRMDDIVKLLQEQFNSGKYE